MNQSIDKMVIGCVLTTIGVILLAAFAYYAIIIGVIGYFVSKYW